MQTTLKLFLTVVFLLFSVNVFSQTCDPKTGVGCEPSSDFSGLPIDQLPPGARSLGLGGAFAGVADDATAAIANPAGLTILTAKEFSLHLRNSDSDVSFLDPDAFDSSLFTVPGRLNKEYSDSGTNVSFASFVLPLDRWVLSAYYQTQLDFKSEQTGGPDVVYDSQFIDTYNNVNSVDSSIDAYGLSAAFRFTDSFSMGITAQYNNFDLNSIDSWEVDNFNDNEFDFYSNLGNATLEQYAAAIVDEWSVSSSINDKDSDLTFGIGLMYSLNSNWSFGLVYRQGAEFSVQTDRVSTNIQDCTGTGVATDECNQFLPKFNVVTSSSLDTKIKVPDTFTFGIGWRPTDTWLISFDINRIGYSDTTPVRSFTQGFGANINGGTMQLTEEIKDGTTYHLGAEKVFVLSNNNTVSIRAGAFTIEDHDGNAIVDSGDTAFTVGLGTTFGSMSQFQMDLGASFSDATNNIILSGIYRF
jgi:long-subunit fatty acid transport protein